MSASDRSGSISVPLAVSEAADFWSGKPHSILSRTDLASLSQRSDGKGWQRLCGHLVVVGVSGTCWGWIWGESWLAIPALIVYGFSLASMFAPLHECVHRTAFASQRTNDGVAWLAGVLSFYNSAVYRRYHKWHHRYTQILGRDPELEDVPPTSWSTYLWQIGGFPWWWGKVHGHIGAALGQFEGCPYISPEVRGEVMRSTWWQLAVYGGAIALSIAVQRPWFFIYWLLPLAVGQPILRFILIAEHTGCSQDDNPLTNTRTTLTIWPIRWLMWNIPFHAEHHLYVSIPFHALPRAHQKLAGHLRQVVSGYVAVNRQIVSRFGRAL